MARMGLSTGSDTMSNDHEDPRHGSQDARRHRLDQQARSDWLDRDEHLSAAWRESRMTRDEFIRHNQKVIDDAIVKNVDG